MRAWTRSTSVIALGFCAACAADKRAVVPIDQATREARAVADRNGPRPPSLVGQQIKFYEIARENPGFAGFFLERNDEATILLSRTGPEARVRPIIANLLAQRAARLKESAASVAIHFKYVRYDYVELASFLARMETIADDGAITEWSLHEGKNAIFVGVRSEDDVEPIRSRLLSLGIPNEALVVVVETPQPTSTLRDHFASAIGGIRVMSLDAGRGCTLGVNVSYGVLQRAFLTASHCSDKPFGLDSRYGQGFGQPDASHLAGKESIDPAGSACTTNPHYFCRYSDAAFVNYSSGYAWDFGSLAWTSSGTTFAFDIPLSGTVNAEDVPSDYWLTMIGSQSGRVSGHVSDLHRNIKYPHPDSPSDTLYVRDAVVVDGTVNEGDSGGPVVWVLGMSSFPKTMHAWLTGIQFAKTGPDRTQFAFSRVEHITEELGTFVVRPVWVSISGPERIDHVGAYTWKSDASGSSIKIEPQYKYKWESSTNGTAWSQVSTASSYSINVTKLPAGPGWTMYLRVTVTGGTQYGQTAISQPFPVEWCGYCGMGF